MSIFPTFPYYLIERLTWFLFYYIECLWIDTGLIRQICFHFSEDRGRLLENQVYNCLKRRNFDIYYHREKRECDFLIVDRGTVISAIQVTVSLYAPSTRKRELPGLQEAMLSYQF